MKLYQRASPPRGGGEIFKGSPTRGKMLNPHGRSCFIWVKPEAKRYEILVVIPNKHVYIYINVYRVVVLPIVFFYPSCAILVMIAIPIDSRLWLKHVFQPATSGSLHCRLVLGGFRLPKSIVTMTTTPIELYKLFPLHCINQWWLNRVSTINRCSIIKLRWLMNMMKPSTSLFHWLTHGAGVSLLHHVDSTWGAGLLQLDIRPYHQRRAQSVHMNSLWVLSYSPILLKRPACTWCKLT